MAINFSNFIQKIKSNKILVLVLVFLSVGIVGFIAYMSIILTRDNGINVDSSIITNITDTSFTVVWQTSGECVGSVLLSNNNDNFGFVNISIKKVETYYDDRDMVETGSNEFERKSSDEIKRRYTHHVTIRGLDPEQKYYFRIMNGISIKELEQNNIVTLETPDTIFQPDVMYASIFKKDGEVIGDDSVVITYAKKIPEVLPVSSCTNSNGTFTLDVSMVRGVDGEVIGPKDEFKEQIFVWSEFGELIKVVDSNYDQPVGSADRPGERLQYGLDSDTYDVMNKSWISENLVSKVYAGAAAPACSAGDSTDQVYGDCCGGGKAREIRRCVDATTGTYYYHFSDCVHDAPQCNGGDTGEGSNNTGGSGLDSVCNRNGSRDCQGYSTDNCESGVDCGNSVCGSCATEPNGGLPDNCENGVKDAGIEEGIDCGGSCPSCPGESLVAQKSQACPPSGCVARTEMTKEIARIQEKESVVSIVPDSLWNGNGMYCLSNNQYYCNIRGNCYKVKECTGGCTNGEINDSNDCKDPVEVLTEGDLDRSLLPGGPDTRPGCVAKFGPVGCSVLEGNVCEWKGGWNDCAYGYTCRSGKCAKDLSVSAAWGSQAVIPAIGVAGGMPEELSNASMQEQMTYLACSGEYPLLDCNNPPNVVPYTHSDGKYCYASGNTLQCDPSLYYNTPELTYWLVRHEATHFEQFQVRDPQGACEISTGAYGTSCRSYYAETGAESLGRGANSGTYVVQTADGKMCAYQAYEVIVEKVTSCGHSEESAAALFYNQCDEYNAIKADCFDACEYIQTIAYGRNTNGEGVDCRQEAQRIAVEAADSSSVNSTSLAFYNKLYADSSTTVPEDGYYAVEVEGVKDSVKFYNLNKGQEIILFYDINGDGFQQSNEPLATDKVVQLKNVVEYTNYKLNAGWNLISLPMVIMDNLGNEIKTSNELLEYFSETGVPVVHIASYKDGGFIVSTQRNKDSYTDGFNLIPGEAYFIKSSQAYMMEISGKKVDGGLEITLNPGWNLVGIYNSEKESYQALELLKDMQSQAIPADILTKWESSRYENVVYEDNIMYGNDFKVYPQIGYWIRVNGENDKKYTPD